MPERAWALDTGRSLKSLQALGGCPSLFLDLCVDLWKGIFISRRSGWLSPLVKSFFSNDSHLVVLSKGEALGFVPSPTSCEHLAMSGFPDGSGVKGLPTCSGATGDEGLNPGSGRSQEEETATHCNISCLENLTDRGAWRAPVHGVTVSDTTEHACTETF